MSSFIALCMTRPMPLEVAEILGICGIAVLCILAVGFVGKRASD
jgi:hypothetical protein